MLCYILLLSGNCKLLVGGRAHFADNLTADKRTASMTRHHGQSPPPFPHHHHQHGGDIDVGDGGDGDVGNGDGSVIAGGGGDIDVGDGNGGDGDFGVID